eukprot:GGOE01014145.1.p1 GENE.GGOE01014145.1~~GGOE01014145.1.p1  ORF type:complete len:690 (+),score=220.54 GGOE01014145.1:104-2071(+)
MPAQFRAQFFANQTAEWQDQYMAYDRLAALFQEERSKRLHSVASTLSSRLSRYSEADSVDDEQPLLVGSFAYELHQELDKVTAFASKTYESALERLHTITKYAASPGHDRALLQKSMVEVCRLFLLLLNYCNVNLAAAYDLAEARGRAFYKGFCRRVEASPPPFANLARAAIPEQIGFITGMHAKLFFNGDVGKAQADLEKHSHQKSMTFGDIFTLGLYIGLCIPLACFVAWVVGTSPFITDSFDLDRLLLVAPILRAFLLLNIMTWLWAVAVTLMNRNRVNHGFVLELNPATTLTEHHICRIAAFDLFLWLLFVLLYAGKAQGQLSFSPHPPEYWIKAYVVVWVAMKLLPTPFAFPFATKRWIFREMVETMAAPLVTVNFASNFIGDFLTSSVKIIIDLWYTACFMYYIDIETLGGQENLRLGVSAFILTGLPLWWRMLQCVRRFCDTRDPWHWVNFGKYCVAVMAVITGFVWPHYRQYSLEWQVGHVLQFLLLVFSTTYGFFWDIFRDWALFVKQPDSSWGYRRMALRYRHLVHFCTVLNLLGRCAWMYTIMVAPPGERWQTEILNFITAFVEIYRRTQWSLLRIGNEHWGNVSNYRAVAVAPLKFSKDAKWESPGESSMARIEEFLREVKPLAGKARVASPLFNPSASAWKK